MLYLTCTTITSEDLAHYGVSPAKDSVICGLWNNDIYIYLSDGMQSNAAEKTPRRIILLCLFFFWCGTYVDKFLCFINNL